MTDLCGCGEPLHYTDPKNEQLVRKMVEEFGETVVVNTGVEAYRVPRHYIAAHGLAAEDLTQLAEHYGWEPVEV